MLPVHTLINQLTTLQSLEVERDLQTTVNFDHRALYVFNSMMLGHTSEEIKSEFYINENRYPQYERPVYNSILNLYNLRPTSAKDHLITEAYYAIHETVYENDRKKAENLERIFNQLKKYEIEQNSVDLLLALNNLHLGTPLQPVYNHLYNKYKLIEEANSKSLKIFEGLNKKLASFLKNRKNQDLTRKMILDYKAIRKLSQESDNNTLTSLLNLTTLMLASIGNQKQLLKDGNSTIPSLLISCKKEIENLPFGVLRLFLSNIHNQIERLKNPEELVTRVNYDILPFRHDSYTECYNFSFPVEVYQQIAKDEKIEKSPIPFIKKTKTYIQAKQNVLSSMAGLNLGSFSFSGGSWSVHST